MPMNSIHGTLVIALTHDHVSGRHSASSWGPTVAQTDEVSVLRELHSGWEKHDCRYISRSIGNYTLS